MGVPHVYSAWHGHEHGSGPVKAFFNAFGIWKRPHSPQIHRPVPLPYPLSSSSFPCLFSFSLSPSSSPIFHQHLEECPSYQLLSSLVTMSSRFSDVLLNRHWGDLSHRSMSSAEVRPCLCLAERLANAEPIVVGRPAEQGKSIASRVPCF